MLSSVLNISSTGLKKAANEYLSSANKISRIGLEKKNSENGDISEVSDKVILSDRGEKTDILKEFVKMELSEICYKANAEVVKISNDMLGTIIDKKV